MPIWILLSCGTVIGIGATSTSHGGVVRLGFLAGKVHA
jgi:hypothetical protein